MRSPILIPPLLALLGTLLLAGCGQKGPLYLPPETPATPAADATSRAGSQSGTSAQDDRQAVTAPVNGVDSGTAAEVLEQQSSSGSGSTQTGSRSTDTGSTHTGNAGTGSAVSGSTDAGDTSQ